MTAYCVTLDIPRLLSRFGAPAPTSVDRVELAYAQYLMAKASERTEFAALHPLGSFGAIGLKAARSFINHSALL